MFRIENGNVIAIAVDEDSACDEAGIHNGNNIISHDNYSTGMLNENVGYLRITDEEYSTNPIFITKNTIKCYSQEMNDDLDGRLEEMRQQGMDRIIR